MVFEQTIVIMVELTDSDFVLLLRAAASEGVTRAELVRKAIAKYLQEFAMKERVLAAAAEAGSSGGESK